jgi:hypothetical protein
MPTRFNNKRWTTVATRVAAPASPPSMKISRCARCSDGTGAVNNVSSCPVPKRSRCNKGTSAGHQVILWGFCITATRVIPNETQPRRKYFGLVTYSERLIERIETTKREIKELLPAIWELMTRAPDPILGRRPGLNPLLPDLTPEETARLDALCNRHYMLNKRIVRDNRTIEELRSQKIRDDAPGKDELEPDGDSDSNSDIETELISDIDPDLISDIDPNAPPETTASEGVTRRPWGPDLPWVFAAASWHSPVIDQGVHQALTTFYCSPSAGITCPSPLAMRAGLGGTDMLLEGRRTVVTGGSRGIGFEISKISLRKALGCWLSHATPASSLGRRRGFQSLRRWLRTFRSRPTLTASRPGSTGSGVRSTFWSTTRVSGTGVLPT